mgnify:CR=1 FL=1
MIERTHIGIFGPRNAGKSSLVNLLTSQEVSIVSNVAGTTTDPVSKPIEINGLGACVFIDTAGYDDYGALGEMRVTKTKEVLKRCDIAIFLIPSTIFEEKEKLQEATKWFTLIKERSKTLLVINHFADTKNETEHKKCDVEKLFGVSEYIEINIAQKHGRDEVLKAIGFVQSQYQQEISIVTHLVKPTETVVLVMPQDIQAPKGRLILPQVQTIRELLDRGCIPICTTPDSMSEALAGLKEAPALIITDSQAFEAAYRQKPEASTLTSFSILFARYKGDIKLFTEGVKALGRLTPTSRILIAEACSHTPQNEDIGRVKLPRILRKKFGEELHIDIVGGNDYPEDLTQYDLVIHCGACMFNRKHVLSRVERARSQGVAITNYGVILAALTGILDRVRVD